MGEETYLAVLFTVMVAAFLLLLVIGIPRGKRMQKTNERIEANQREILENSHRQATALERIAESLEKR